MKVLIDEQLPVKLKYRFAEGPYDVYTVKDMGWLGKKNGELLKLMIDNKFDALITNDKNMYYQQRIEGFNITVVNINTKTNRYPDIMESIDNIKKKLLEISMFPQQDKAVGRYVIIS